MQKAAYPSITVETKYGAMSVEFRDPRGRMEDMYQDGVRAMQPTGAPIRMTGTLRINRIDVELGESAKPGPVREDGTSWYLDGRVSYSKRAGSYHTDSLTAAIRRIIYTELREIGATVYSERPDLAVEAGRIFLYNVMVKAKEARDAAWFAAEGAAQMLYDAESAAALAGFPANLHSWMAE